jgi:hypothetical protein
MPSFRHETAGTGSLQDKPDTTVAEIALTMIKDRLPKAVLFAVTNG